MNLRRMALALVNHAGKILPPERSAWAQAMMHEVQYIEGDFHALTWAMGCVMASYAAATYVWRSAVAKAIHAPFLRALLALIITGEALNMLFATAMTAAYRTQFSGLAEFLGKFTPGDDYQRFVPLMEAEPWWVHGLWGTASVLLVISAWRLLQQRSAAFALFAGGWVLATAGDLISQSLPAYKAAFSFAQPMFIRDCLIPAAMMLIPITCAALLLVHDRWLVKDLDR